MAKPVILTSKDKGDIFEMKIYELIRKNKIECNLTRTATKNKFHGDGNIDIFGNYKNMNFIIQLKWKSNEYKVGPSDIREFLYTLFKQPKDTVGFFITNSDYTPNAIIECENSKLHLLLCNENNIIENINIMYKNISEKKDNFSVIDEFNIDNLVLDKDSQLDIFNIKINGNCKIGKISSKKILVNKYSPY